MLKIRLQRVGRKNHAEFRIVLTEHSRSAKSSNYLLRFGSYNPHTNIALFDSKEKINEWIKKGAQPSDTVHNLLVKNGVIEGKKRNVLPKKTAPIPLPSEKSEEKKEEKEEKKDVEKSEEKESPTKE
jgi:small subunit ribosomal protein S16